MPRWLQKRGLVWHYRFNAGGRDYSGSTEATDLPTAKLVLEEARRQAILLGIGQGKAPTLGTVITEWLKGKPEGRHKEAAKKNRDILKALAKLPVDQISTPLVQRWAVGWMKDHSVASVNHILRYLKLWVRYALAEGMIREMPYRLPAYPEQQRPRPVADLSLLDKVCATATNPQIRAALALCMTCGLREAELLGARWEWIQGEEFIVQGPTKSKKIRTVPLAPIALVELHAYAGEELPRLGLIFPGKDGKPHSKGWLRQALARSEVKGLGMHRLRATFATLHLRAKTPLKEVQEMLGHQDARTTLIYQETNLEDKKKRQENLWA